jgi:PLP dependent protein
MVGNSLAERDQNLRARIETAARRADRDPASIRVVAVTKGVSSDVIREAFALGHRDFGENYVQEWREKRSQVPGCHWHFIGHLQTNKVREVVGHVALIHSVDRQSLAETIGRQAAAAGIEQPVLLEVSAGEENKSGLMAEEGARLSAEWALIPGLRLDGLMIMPPFTPRPADSREHFTSLRRCLDEWRPGVLKSGRAHPWRELSMGTSQDFAVAIEEGATVVRLGTTLFGERKQKKVGDP